MSKKVSKVSKNSNCNVELLQDEIRFLQNIVKTKDTQIQELETNIQMQNQYVERLETDYKLLFKELHQLTQTSTNQIISTQTEEDKAEYDTEAIFNLEKIKDLDDSFE